MAGEPLLQDLNPKHGLAAKLLEIVFASWIILTLTSLKPSVKCIDSVDSATISTSENTAFEVTLILRSLSLGKLRIFFI